MQVVIRRTKPRQFVLGDFVRHAQHGTGIIDTIIAAPPARYYVSRWDGRGPSPFLYVADRFVAPAGQLILIELPPKVSLSRVVRRR